MSHESELRTLRTIAKVMDRFYVDPIVGLFLPGVGDILTSATGLYSVVLAVRMGVPRVTVARMLVNLAVDTLFGAVPVAGDAFDAWFKAHERNLRLLEQRATGPSSSTGSTGSIGSTGTGRDGLYVAGAALLFLAAMALPVVLVVWALRQI